MAACHPALLARREHVGVHAAVPVVGAELLGSAAWSAKLRRASGPTGEPSHQSSARKPPDLPDAAHATPVRSTTVTRTPRRVR